MADGELNMREQLAHIDQMLADTRRLQMEHDRIWLDQGRIVAETKRRQQEIWWQPSLAIASMLTACAAFFAAGAAVATFILRGAGHG